MCHLSCIRVSSSSNLYRIIYILPPLFGVQHRDRHYNKQVALFCLAGVMLVLLASLYLLLTCKNRFETKDLLLQSREDSYDR